MRIIITCEQWRALVHLSLLRMTRNNSGNRRMHLEEREWEMDRNAMDYRDAATASPLGGGSSDIGTDMRPGREQFDRQQMGREQRRPVLQHRRADGQITTGQVAAHQVTHVGGGQAAARNVQTVALQSILKGAREAIIDFDGAAYRLRITRNHRLILTK